MQVSTNGPEQPAELADARGVPVETYVEEVLGRASQHATHQDLRAMGEAIDQRKELRKGNTPSGLQIEDLIDEGRNH